MHHTERLSFARCRTFNLNEYVGLEPGDPRSYHDYMKDYLFEKVDMDPRNTHLPDGMADDLTQEAQLYEAKIAEAGGIDLQLLGLGETGHRGFNEPLSSLRSRTRDKTLTPTTRRQNADTQQDLVKYVGSVRESSKTRSSSPYTNSLHNRAGAPIARRFELNDPSL